MVAESDTHPEQLSHTYIHRYINHETQDVGGQRCTEFRNVNSEGTGQHTSQDSSNHRNTPLYLQGLFPGTLHLDHVSGQNAVFPSSFPKNENWGVKTRSSLARETCTHRNKGQKDLLIKSSKQDIPLLQSHESGSCHPECKINPFSL